jgi:hypothetical protein
VFLLAEWETRDLHTRAFDLSYARSWNEAMHRIATGRSDLDALRVFYAWSAKSWPPRGPGAVPATGSAITRPVRR